MVYDDRHRTFLQAIMQGGAVIDDEAQALCFKIFNDRIKVSAVAELVNEKLAPIEMAIKAGICELTGDKYWSVIGTVHDETLMLPSEFSNAQRAFLRLIYAEIIHSDDGCISSTDCLNLSTTLDMKLPMADADKFLKSVSRRKWLHMKDGCVYMGVRSIVEMMPYFRATFMDNFNNCFLCHEIVFSGQKCENCDKMFHNYCLAKYTSMQKDNKCPKCKRAWDECEIPGEVRRTQETQENQEEEEEEGEEPMNVSNEEEPSPVSEKSQKTKRRKRRHDQ